ncbi:hypothetical protein K457DRAFT_157849 [Linnemannia elongata AG-77]|uniref:Uncharacterized protein n=1 Tax=Linnemannia elongata AG-77 TaxID=1314771 RepID=A0A197JLA0_9FUNG|nr:hypothetical protein K457DRAFT_157849 [Linnemannia elongata AG-77]
MTRIQEKQPHSDQLQEEISPRYLSIYLDGSPPDQKAKAHSERAINRHKTIKEIDVLLEKVKKNSEAGKWTAKTVVKSITKKLASIFRMSPDFTRTFLDGLRSVFSDVVICEGEADTHIAQSITKNPHATIAGVDFVRVAVSSDSDLLGYRSVSFLLRKLSGSAGSGFRLIRKDDLLPAFKFETVDQLEALAIVSDNDYHKNIFQYGWFVGMDGVALERPKDSIPIEWFMRMNQASGAFKDYPRSSWTATFCLFSEEDLVHILYPIETIRPILQSLLGGKGTQVDLVDKVLNQKGILIQKLLYPVGKGCSRRSRPSGYHHKLSLQSDPSDTKLKLRPVIRTNGLVFHLLAYDTTDKRKRAAKEKGSTTATGNSGLYDADDDDIDFLLDPAFLQDDTLSSTSEPLQSTTTSPSSSLLTSTAGSSSTLSRLTSTPGPSSSSSHLMATAGPSSSSSRLTATAGSESFDIGLQSVTILDFVSVGGKARRRSLVLGEIRNRVAAVEELGVHLAISLDPSWEQRFVEESLTGTLVKPIEDLPKSVE